MLDCLKAWEPHDGQQNTLGLVSRVRRAQIHQALISILPEARKDAKKLVREFPFGRLQASAAMTSASLINRVVFPWGHQFVVKYQAKVTNLVTEGELTPLVLGAVVSALETVLTERDHFCWMGIPDEVAMGELRDKVLVINPSRDNVCGKNVQSFTRGEEGSGKTKFATRHLLAWQDQMRRVLGHEKGAINVSPLPSCCLRNELTLLFLVPC